MVLYNPKILIFDFSFQLSFIATIGLLYVSPSIEKLFRFLPSKFQVREIFAATISTQILVLPLLLYRTGEISLVALPVNLLILASVPFTMLFGFLAGSIGFISTLLALPFSFIAYVLLEYELSVIELFSRPSFASIAVQNFSLYAMAALYAVYAFIVWKINR